MGVMRPNLRLPQEVPDPGESEGESVSCLADLPRSRISVADRSDTTSTCSQAFGVTCGGRQIPCATASAAHESKQYYTYEHTVLMCGASTSAWSLPVRSRRLRSLHFGSQIDQSTSARLLNPNGDCSGCARCHDSPRPLNCGYANSARTTAPPSGAIHITLMSRSWISLPLLRSTHLRQPHHHLCCTISVASGNH